MSVDCEPVPGYGSYPLTWSYTADDYGSAIGRAEGAEMAIALTSDLRFGFERRRARGRVAMRAGERAFVALTWSGASAPTTYEEADEALERTADFWRRWLGHGSFTDHEWAPVLQRSALTLKGLSYAPTGALLAASTTSLPETPGGERNWDYRYSWIRDSTFMLWALGTLGFGWEANDFFCFLADVGAEGDLQIMYGVGGETGLKEKVLEHLAGYEGARPVRVGNAAFDQRQHDVWGSVLDSIYLHTSRRDDLRESVWPLLVRQVEAAAEHARTRPGHLGGRGGAAPSSPPPSSCAGSRRTVVAALRGSTATRSVPIAGAPWRRNSDADIRSAGVGRGGVRPALRHHGAGRLAVVVTTGAVPAGQRRPAACDGARHCRRADRRRACAAVPGGGDR